MNLPSCLLPSIDLTYVDDNYLKISSKSLWDAWASFRSDRSKYNKVHKLNDTKYHFYEFLNKVDLLQSVPKLFLQILEGLKGFPQIFWNLNQISIFIGYGACPLRCAFSLHLNVKHAFE
ncbi:hypothetical protein GmHk_16G045921 [Glycine max]|nr:hypothetical protein GmHk_16G045921 [Glycine max]